MKPQSVLPAIAICAVLSARLFADEPASTNAEEKANPPTGRFTIIDHDWIGPIDAGQFLGAIAFGNQLGIEVTTVESPLRAHLDLKEGQGVVVTSPAAEGQSTTVNLKAHDVVLQIDGQQITGPEQFNELVGGRKGKKAVVHILRKGKPMDLEVTFPDTPVYQFANQLAASNTLIWADNQYRIGVTLAPADDVLRSQLRLADGEGLAITDIVADGPSAQAGLRKHDVLVKLDGKRLTTVDACNAQIQEIKDRKIAATVFRGGKELSFELAPQLSATAQLTTAPYLSTLLLDNTTSADRWVGRLNLNTSQADLIHFSQPNVRWYDATNLRGLAFTDPAQTGTLSVTAAAPTSPAEQVAQLKRQLEEMQKSLSTLEATLRPAKPDQASPQSPEQKPYPQTEKPQP